MTPHYKTPRRIILHPSPPKKKKKMEEILHQKSLKKKKKKPLEEISSPTWRILRALSGRPFFQRKSKEKKQLESAVGKRKKETTQLQFHGCDKSEVELEYKALF